MTPTLSLHPSRPIVLGVKVTCPSGLIQPPCWQEVIQTGVGASGKGLDPRALCTQHWGGEATRPSARAPGHSGSGHQGALWLHAGRNLQPTWLRKKLRVPVMGHQRQGGALGCLDGGGDPQVERLRLHPSLMDVGRCPSRLGGSPPTRPTGSPGRAALSWGGQG